MTPLREIRLPGRLRAVSVAAGRGQGAGREPADGSCPPACAAPGPQGPRGDQAPDRLDAEIAALRHARDAMTEAAAKLDQARQDVFSQAEEELVGLALDIARKVLMHEIQSANHQIDPIVREAMSRIPARTRMVVRLHPEDLANCGLACKDQAGSGPGSIRFVADPAVGRAECIVATEEGTVESSVEAHLEEIAEALKSPE